MCSCRPISPDSGSEFNLCGGREEVNLTACLPHNSLILRKEKTWNPDCPQSRATHGQNHQYKRCVETDLSVTSTTVFLLVPFFLFADEDD